MEDDKQNDAKWKVQNKARVPRQEGEFGKLGGAPDPPPPPPAPRTELVEGQRTSQWEPDRRQEGAERKQG